MNFYIADTHFGHKNIIRYDNRPFKNVIDMDDVIIKNWNKAVTDNDTVYIIGDISWYDYKRTAAIFNSLNGHNILIKGNHDRVNKEITSCFDRICDYLEIQDDNEKVVMSHYPMLFWNGQFRDSIHLYGHVHNSHQWNACESFRKELKQLQDIPMRMYNVGCMMKYMNYTPRTLKHILENAEGN